MLKYKTYPQIQPSPPEKIIIRYLNNGNFYYEREVEFETCINPLTGNHLRFDFYLPEQKTLIEYDGIEFHTSLAVRQRDRHKTEFAQKVGLRLIRVQGLRNISKLFNNELNIKITKPIIGEAKVERIPIDKNKLVPNYIVKNVKDFKKVLLKDRVYVMARLRKSNPFLWDRLMWKHYSKEIQKHRRGQFSKFYS